MAYEHGIRVIENPTSLPQSAKNEAGVPVIFGTAPVNLASDPSNATNVLFLCNTFAEAQAAVGYSGDYDKYTLCQAMDTFFKAYAVAPIIICNVLDPATHKSSFTEDDIEVVDGIATASTIGIILDALVVKDGTTVLDINDDYTLEFNDDGALEITVIKAGVTKVSLSGNKLNPSAVQASDIIGSVNTATGKETGLELLRRVYPKFGRYPSFIMAPGWSQIANVGIAMQNKCTNINGMFKCECLLDLDTTTVTKYTDVKAAKAAAGYTSEHSIVLWPSVKYNGKRVQYSAMYGALATYMDLNNDNVPNLYPSNQKLNIQAAIVADGTEIDMDKVQANELNDCGVVTILNLNGLKSWGDETACWPDNIDPKDHYIGCRRFFSWWGNSFIETYLSKVDNPMNRRLIDSIIDAENVRGNSMVSSGKCAGVRTEYRADDNPIESILAGKVVFRQYLAPYTPAKDILDILEFDPAMLEAELTGGEE